MLKSFTQLKKVKITSSKEITDNDEKEKHELFINEIDFYTKMKSTDQRKKKEYAKILSGCEPEAMFEGLTQNIEDKAKNMKMPVRKFFNNTFGILLNDALFKLQKQ